MTEKKEKKDPVAQVVTYLALLLQHIGGDVTIPFEELEKGLPVGHGVHMEQDEDGNLYMAIRSADEH